MDDPRALPAEPLALDLVNTLQAAPGLSQAWTGRLRRQVVEQESGESPYDALRRALNQSARAGP